MSKPQGEALAEMADIVTDAAQPLRTLTSTQASTRDRRVLALFLRNPGRVLDRSSPSRRT